MPDKEFVEALVCPRCKVDLKYVEEMKSLLCEKCGRIYEIADNIIVLNPKDEKER